MKFSLCVILHFYTVVADRTLSSDESLCSSALYGIDENNGHDVIVMVPRRKHLCILNLVFREGWSHIMSDIDIFYDD